MNLRKRHDKYARPSPVSVGDEDAMLGPGSGICAIDCTAFIGYHLRLYTARSDCCEPNTSSRTTFTR